MQMGLTFPHGTWAVQEQKLLVMLHCDTVTVPALLAGELVARLLPVVLQSWHIAWHVGLRCFNHKPAQLLMLLCGLRLMSLQGCRHSCIASHLFLHSCSYTNLCVICVALCHHSMLLISPAIIAC